MASLTTVFGVLLVVLGLAGYFGTGRQSPTALIPALFGLLFILLGAMARSARLRMHAMHGAALLSLIGFAATVPGVIKLLKWAGGTAPARPAAVASQSVMAGLMLVFLVLCIRSFVNVRRARRAGVDVPSPSQP